MGSVDKDYTNTTRADFEELFPSVVEEILEPIRRKNLPQEVIARFKEVWKVLILLLITLELIEYIET